MGYCYVLYVIVTMFMIDDSIIHFQVCEGFCLSMLSLLQDHAGLRDKSESPLECMGDLLVPASDLLKATLQSYVLWASYNAVGGDDFPTSQGNNLMEHRVRVQLCIF